MYIDTHCHIDMFDDPISIAKAYDTTKTICVMTTMLPSHYQAALPHLKMFPTIYPAIGMHPLRSNEAIFEIDLFKKLINSTTFVGEIGLDYSSIGKPTRKQQLDIMKNILPLIGSNKFVTVHSRNANEEIAILLDEYNINPVCFHYFIGGENLAFELSKKGHFFSINHKMLSNKHREILNVIPKEKILVETDGPYITKQPLKQIEYIYTELSKIWGIGQTQVGELILTNFKNCRTIVK